MNQKIALACGADALALVATWQLSFSESTPKETSTVSTNIVTIRIPEVQGSSAQGKLVFDSACASCHGENAVGIKGVAPPLVHKIYEPSHHGDEAFQRAVATGVKSHHWEFGDMPAIRGVTRADVMVVTEYIRELQRANGIH